MADETKEGGDAGQRGSAAAVKAPSPSKAKGGGGGSSSGKSKDKAPAAPVDHTPKAVEGTPRLQEYYEKTVRPRLAKEFGLANPNQVPQLVKIVLNVGMGDAGKNPKQLDAAVE